MERRPEEMAQADDGRKKGTDQPPLCFPTLFFSPMVASALVILFPSLWILLFPKPFLLAWTFFFIILLFRRRLFLVLFFPFLLLIIPLLLSCFSDMFSVSVLVSLSFSDPDLLFLLLLFLH